MIYKALEVILIFGADGRTGERANEGVLRGPRGPKNTFPNTHITYIHPSLELQDLILIPWYDSFIEIDG